MILRQIRSRAFLIVDNHFHLLLLLFVHLLRGRLGPGIVEPVDDLVDIVHELHLVSMPELVGRQVVIQRVFNLV